VHELIKRGYSAYDADDGDLHLTRLEVKETGKPVDWPEGYVDWSYYAWSADEVRLKELLESNETTFIVGFLGNQEKLYHYFDKLIALAVGPVEHERRLRARPKREFGDDEQNIQRRLDKYPMHMERFIAFGFVVIDNSGSVEHTVDHIQQAIDQSPDSQGLDS
jgi:hypothetical protein